MTRIEGSVEIDAPIENVFAYAADWRKWGEWFEGVSDFRPTSDVVQGNGARYAYKARLMGIPASVETEIHDYSENEGWIGVSTKGMQHQTQWIFEQANVKTKFTYILEYKLPLPLLGTLLDSLFLKPEWRRIIDRSLQNLKKHLDGQRGVERGSSSQESNRG